MSPRDSSTSSAKRADPRWTLVACILASSLSFVDGSVLNVALPAIKAGYGPTIRFEAVKKLVDSVTNYQERSREIIEEMRVLSTKNAEEIRTAVEEGKQRLARLTQQGLALQESHA